MARGHLLRPDVVGARLLLRLLLDLLDLLWRWRCQDSVLLHSWLLLLLLCQYRSDVLLNHLTVWTLHPHHGQPLLLLLHDGHLLRVQLHPLRLLLLLLWLLLLLLLHVILLLLLLRLHGHPLLQVLRLHHHHSLLRLHLRLLLLLLLRPLLLHHQDLLLLLWLHLRMELLLRLASDNHALSSRWQLLHHLLRSNLLLLLRNDHPLARLQLLLLDLTNVYRLPDLPRLLWHLNLRLLLLLLLRHHHSRLLLLLLLNLNGLRLLLWLHGHLGRLELLLQLRLAHLLWRLVGIEALLTLKRFLLLVSVIGGDHVVLPRLLPDLLQGLLGVVGFGGHSVELRLVGVVQLEAVLAHRPLLRI